ncbi:MAG: tetratricopeptide repeat protein [Phycisphaerales bacterium]|nr:MAG: tetratricopeptide repeat protein [Phycisphaerales bacterium]
MVKRRKRKRLNKKVALAGTTVFLLIVLVVVLAVLGLNRDPQKFIEDGDAAFMAQDYEAARRHYLKAYGLAKDNSLKIDLLFKLAELYRQTDDWPKVRGCWEQIVTIDPKNVRARLGGLKFLYIVSDDLARGSTNRSQRWELLVRQASELLEVAELAGLLSADKAKYEPSFGPDVDGAGPSEGQLLGPYLYLVRGRARYELAKMRAVTAPDELLGEAMTDLQKAQELDPNKTDAYWYMASAVEERGEILASRGIIEERSEAAKQALEILERAVEVAGGDPAAHVNLLRKKFEILRNEGGVLDKQQVQSLETEFLALTEKFPTSARAFAELSEFYSFYPAYSDFKSGIKNLDRATEAAEKAIELDKENVPYAVGAAELYYRKFSVYGQKEAIHTAIEIAKNALTLPGVQDTDGPKSYANRINRYASYSLLARCYIEQAIEPRETRTEQQTQLLLTEAERAIHEIEQIFGSGEEPEVVKWQGMLELARGNTNLAVRKLFAAYEQFTASEGRAPGYEHLCYILARIFRNSPELGAVNEFLVNAINGGIMLSKPEAILDYLEVIGKWGMWSHIISPANPYSVDVYEGNFGSNRRSRALRIRALIGANQVSEAEEALAKLDQNDPDTIKLGLELVEAKIKQISIAIARRQTREDSTLILEPTEQDAAQGEESDVSIQLMTADLDEYRTQRAGLVHKMLITEPNLVSEASVVAVWNSYVKQGRMSEAKDLVNRFLAHSPDSATALFHKQLLSESDPANVPKERRYEIEEQVLSNIADPDSRAIALGAFYRKSDESEKAIEQFKKVLETVPPQDEGAEKPAFGQPGKANLHLTAANNLFATAIASKDWALAEYVVGQVRLGNLDECGGQLFGAQLAAAKGDYKDASVRIEEVLRLRPVFSYAYMLRGNIHAALGNEHASIEDIRRAAHLNPLDGAIAKGLVAVLYRRNQQLGDRVSSEEIAETKRELERAIRLNTGDLALLSTYAEYISSEEPLKALAIRQTMLKRVPNLSNAVLLGNLATTLAVKETNVERKEALFEIAASSLEQARSFDPNNRQMLDVYARYYRSRGQTDEAEQLLRESDNQKLLWRHYFRLGQFGDAKSVLEQLYERQAKDSDVLKGFLVVAERTGDKEAVRRYSEELLSLEDSMENRLDQIRAFLSIGLVKESEYKLESFKEKHPDEPEALLIEGWLAMRQGQLEKALALTNQCLQGGQENATAWRLRGQINHLMGNHDQAISDLRLSRSLSDSAITRIVLAKAYLQVGREDDAIIELKSTLAAAGPPVEARLLLEQIYIRLGKNEELKEFYDDILVKFPKSVYWHSRAGAAAIAMREYDRAEQLYGRAYEIGREVNPGQSAAEVVQDVQHARALDGYLQALVLGAGDPGAASQALHPEKLDKALQESGKYIDTGFAPIAYYRMAEAKLKLGEKAQTVEYCRKAVDKAGDNEQLATEILLRMFLLVGEEEVSKYCREKLQTEPDSLATNFTMFNLAKIKGEYNNAENYIDKCIELAGADSNRGVDYGIKKARVLTLAYEKTSDNGYLEKAITVYESLRRKMPKNTGVLNNLAYMLAASGQRLAEALGYSKQALEQAPDNPGFLDTYAYVLHKNGKDSEAAEYMAAALQQYEQNEGFAPPEMYEHLGMIKEKLGQGPQAVDAYKQALEIGAGKLSDAVKERITLAIERLSQ